MRRTGNGTIVAISVADLEKTDGTLVELHGPVDRHVKLKNGTVLNFEKPIRAERQEDELVVRSSNRPATEIAIDDIDTVSVAKYAPVKTIAITTGASAVISLILALAITSSVKLPALVKATGRARVAPMEAAPRAPGRTLPDR